MLRALQIILFRLIIPGLRRSPRGVYRSIKYLTGVVLFWLGILLLLGAIVLIAQTYLPLAFAEDSSKLLDVKNLIGSALKLLPGLVLITLGNRVGNS